MTKEENNKRKKHIQMNVSIQELLKSGVGCTSLKT